MLAKQKQLIAEGWNPKVTKPGEKQLEARKQALELAGPMREQPQKSKAELADSLAKEREGAEADKFAKMSPAQKRSTLGKQRDSLYGEATEASGKGDELTAAQKRLEAAWKQKEIDGLAADDPQTTAGRMASVTVSSLQSVGGVSSDPQLKQMDTTNQTLDRIARAVLACRRRQFDLPPRDPAAAHTRRRQP